MVSTFSSYKCFYSSCLSNRSSGISSRSFHVRRHFPSLSLSLSLSLSRSFSLCLSLHKNGSLPILQCPFPLDGFICASRSRTFFSHASLFSRKLAVSEL